MNEDRKCPRNQPSAPALTPPAPAKRPALAGPTWAGLRPAPCAGSAGPIPARRPWPERAAPPRVSRVMAAGERSRSPAKRVTGCSTTSRRHHERLVHRRSRARGADPGSICGLNLLFFCSPRTFPRTPRATPPKQRPPSMSWGTPRPRPRPGGPPSPVQGRAFSDQTDSGPDRSRASAHSCRCGLRWRGNL